MNTYQIPYAIRWGLPGCHTKAGESQTNLSLALRVTSCAIGCLGILAGAIIAAGILRSVPTACGWSLVVGGSCVSLMAIALKMTKKQTINPPFIADPVLPGAAQSIPVSNAIPLCPENEKQQKKVLDQRLAAAIQIQTLWRGHVAKRTTDKLKRTFLRLDEIDDALPYMNDTTQLLKAPRAPNGDTPVYLLPQLVVKKSGFPQNKTRLLKTQQARAICERNNYQCLIIPKARTYQDFIVESKLPILHGTKKIMGLYMENKEPFSQAVSEFTGFLCQSDFQDITINWFDNYSVLATTPIGRYDNVALYMEEGKGKIGLIDLEHFTPLQSFPGSCYNQCATALCFFPCHLEEIIQAAKKFDPKIEQRREDLEKIRKESLKRFDLVHTDHLQFIQKQGITDPLQPIPLTEEHREQIKKGMRVFLETTDLKDHYCNGCLGSNHINVLATFFTQVFPNMVRFAYKIMEDQLSKNMQTYNYQTPLSIIELLDVRTLQSENAFSSIGTFWREDLLNMFVYKNDRVPQILFNELMNQLFHELARCGVIAYYNPCLGGPGRGRRYIFC